MPRLKDETHEAFCRLYVGEAKRNGLAAAKMLGMHPDTIYGWMQAEEVPARIRELSEKLLSAADITADRVVLELGRVAFADLRKAYNDEGELRHPHEMDDDAAAAVAGIEHRTEHVPDGYELDLTTGKRVKKMRAITVTKVKRYDKNPALQVLAKHFKLVGDEGDGVNALASALADRLKSARQRVEGGNGGGTGGDIT